MPLARAGSLSESTADMKIEIPSRAPRIAVSVHQHRRPASGAARLGRDAIFCCATT